MKRQCAWCLRLIDSTGGCISPTPQPKLYDATHGMCEMCGMQWIEQVVGTQASVEMILQIRAKLEETSSLFSL